MCMRLQLACTEVCNIRLLLFYYDSDTGTGLLPGGRSPDGEFRVKMVLLFLDLLLSFS